MARAVRIVRSKYNARPTMVDGVRFASSREAKRYVELKLLQKAGQISRLLLQPAFGLYVQTSDGGELVKVGRYVGDFQYQDASGQQVVEDVKGVRTPVYRLKKRLVEALYGISIREVR